MKVEKFKRFSLKLLCCEARVFPVGTAKTRMHMNLDTWLVALLFLGETFSATSIIAYWPFSPLAVSMPPTKVCPQCKAAVPIRRKTCEHCDLVFRFKPKAECNSREKTV